MVQANPNGNLAAQNNTMRRPAESLTSFISSVSRNDIRTSLATSDGTFQSTWDNIMQRQTTVEQS